MNIFSEVRTLQNHRKTLTSNPEVRTLQNHRKTQTSNPEVRTLQNHRKNPDFQPRGQSFTKSQKNLDFSPYRRILSILSIEAVVVCEKSSDSDSFILRNCNFIALNFLAQINVDYPGRRPQAPACFKYVYIYIYGIHILYMYNLYIIYKYAVCTLYVYINYILSRSTTRPKKRLKLIHPLKTQVCFHHPQHNKKNIMTTFY